MVQGLLKGVRVVMDAGQAGWCFAGAFSEWDCVQTGERK